MDAPPSSLQTFHSTNGDLKTPTPNEPQNGDMNAVDLSNPTVQIPPQSSNPINHNGDHIKRKKKKKKKNKQNPPINLSPSSPPSCSSSSSKRGVRVANNRRNPRILVGLNPGGGGGSNVEAMALPLGMSIAAVMAQVLEREAGERMSVDHLSMICTLAIRESLANVFGDKFDCFAENFEKSFRSTLRTLRLINESSVNRSRYHSSHKSVQSLASDASPLTPLNNETASMNTSIKSLCSEAVSPTAGTQEQLSTHEVVQENMQTDLMVRELALHGQINQQLACVAPSTCIKSLHSEAVSPTAGTQERLSTHEVVQDNMQTDSMVRELALRGQINQQLACVAPSTLGSVFNHSILSTVEKSVMEQVRANDLKTFEISLLMKKLKLDETKLSLDSDSNLLERLKLSMGISKASFKAERFKNQLQDTRHAELLKKCIDCLVAGLLIMSASLAYGAYVHSYGRITDATASCTPPKESNSWWMPKPMASFNSGLSILSCQVQVVSRMLFGVLMILLIAYLLLQRSATSQQTTPVTSILLILGLACGYAGKLCVDTLGGSGYDWLLYWEALCSLHFFSNVCTSALFFILHGPIDVSQGERGTVIFPYWVRRVLFYAVVLLFLPLFCGLVPFASPGEWKDHFSIKVTDYLMGN